MTKNQKIAIGLGAGLLVYWVWSRNKAGKSLNPFAKSSSFEGPEDEGDDEEDDESTSSFLGFGKKKKKRKHRSLFGGMLSGVRNNSIFVASYYDPAKNTTFYSHVPNKNNGFSVEGQMPVGDVKLQAPPVVNL